MPSPPRQGIIPAIWTPLNRDGSVDTEALKTLVQFTVENGVDGLLVLGSTGRFVHLSLDDRNTVARIALETAGGKPCVVNVSDLKTANIERLSACARDHGAAAVAAMTPWYYEIGADDQIEWFARTAAVSKLPLWLYNFPERTGNRITESVVEAMCRRSLLAGFKQSGADESFITALVRLAGRYGFAVFAGTDARVAESVRMGADGVIGGLAGALPEATVKVFHSLKEEGRMENEGIGLLRDAAHFMSLLPFPLSIAASLEARGLPIGTLPDHLCKATLAHYQQAVAELGDLFKRSGIERLA